MMSQMHPVLTDVLREIVRAVMEIVMIFLTSTIESLSSYLESDLIIQEQEAYFKIKIHAIHLTQEGQFFCLLQQQKNHRLCR